jgi:chromosome segregation ATPase
MNKKDLYKQKLQAQLDEWQADVNKMKAQLGGASVGAKMEINQELNQLEANLAEGREKLEELSQATEDNWENLKDSLDETWEGIGNSFKNVFGKF